MVLELMVEEGDSFSMASVARKASCSKETLYNWFGDRDGLLTATVQWQASKVRMPELIRETLAPDTFRASLIAFAENWLNVISSDISIALNRAAISHAGSGKSRLGEIVLHNGPYAMKQRLLPIFQLGVEAGLLRTDDPSQDEMFRSFFGLVVGDQQIRALLGEVNSNRPKDNQLQAEKAAYQFLSLYGVENKFKLQSNKTS